MNNCLTGELPEGQSGKGGLADDTESPPCSPTPSTSLARSIGSAARIGSGTRSSSGGRNSAYALVADGSTHSGSHAYFGGGDVRPDDGESLELTTSHKRNKNTRGSVTYNVLSPTVIGLITIV